MEKNINDHDLLVRLDIKVDGICKNLTNHLAHHFRINLMAWGAALSAICALIIFILTKK